MPVPGSHAPAPAPPAQADGHDLTGPFGRGHDATAARTVDANQAREANRVDNPAGYLHLGFIVISLPNLALIAAMIVVFVIALLVPFPREGGGRRGGGSE